MSPKSIDSIYSSRISAREQHFNYSAQWKWVRVSDVSWWIHCEIYNWCGSHSCTRRKSKGNREKRREKRRLRRFVKTRFIAKLILEEWNTPFPAKRNQFMNEKTKNKKQKRENGPASFVRRTRTSVTIDKVKCDATLPTKIVRETEMRKDNTQNTHQSEKKIREQNTISSTFASSVPSFPRTSFVWLNITCTRTHAIASRLLHFYCIANGALYDLCLYVQRCSVGRQKDWQFCVTNAKTMILMLSVKWISFKVLKKVWTKNKTLE